MSPIYVPGKVVLRRDFTWNETIWNPSMIQTALWLDAADAGTVTTVSGAVSQWNDKSGNGRNATQPQIDQRPALTSAALNGLNVVAFDGLDDWLTAGTAANWAFLHGTGGSEVIALWKVGTTSDPDTLYALYNTNNGTVNNTGSYIVYDDRSLVPRNNSVVYVGAPAGGSMNFYLSGTSDVMLPNQASILNVRIDLANSTPAAKISHFVNGTFSAGSSTNPDAVTGAIPFNALHIGRFNSSTGFLNGYIAELIIVPSLLNTINRQRIEGYLAHKWGLTANLPADHPYKTVGPTP